jgi:hypothetical protein
VQHGIDTSAQRGDGFGTHPGTFRRVAEIGDDRGAVARCGDDLVER